MLVKHLLLLGALYLLPAGLKAQNNDSTNYRESTVYLDLPAGKMAGTLCIPKPANKKTPVALIIAGSGPTDRNGNSAYLNSDAYKLLAHALSREGIATLRYDKRGVGESKLNDVNPLFDIFADDAKEWISFLRKDRRFTTITVIGHSQGSLVGILSADNADKFISIAGIGEKGDSILRKQFAQQPQFVQDLALPILDSLSRNRTVDSVPAVLNTIFKRSSQPYIISWIKYDPQVEIKKLKVPVLIIQGTNDIQVTVEDAAKLASGNKKSKLVLIKNMNHLFRIVTGDKQSNLATYQNPGLPISEELIRAVSKFILE